MTLTSVSPASFSACDGVLHRVEGQGQETAQADDLRAGLFDRFDEFGGRHIHAQVGDFKAVDIQHEADDILGDVMDVALDGAEHDLAESSCSQPPAACAA